MDGQGMMQRIRLAHWLVLFATLLAGCTRNTVDFDGVAQRETPTQCGVERWDVKTMTDPAAQRVNLTPTSATVEQLTALSVPAEFSRDAERLPSEFQTYTVQATILEFKEEADSDIHLVIVGTSGETMIAEIPDPACAQGSRVEAQITGARGRFVDLFGQPSRSSWVEVNAPITVTGVLFFDVHHGQTGVAPNAVELHPVVAIGP
jgi:predicted small secreted protein